MHSSKERKPINNFNKERYFVHFRVKIRWETILQLRKKEGWHRCDTCQMDSDAKVSGDVERLRENGVSCRE